MVGTVSIASATRAGEIASSELPAAARATASRTASRSLSVPPRTATLRSANIPLLLAHRYTSCTDPATSAQATAATTTAAARRRNSTAADSCTRPVSPRPRRLLPPGWVGLSASHSRLMGPKQLHLVLEIDVEALAHGAAREHDQGRDIGRKRAAGVLDEVGVDARDARAADHVALEPAGLDQRPRARALGRVLEDRAERARLARLARAAPALELPHAGADLLARTRLQLQDGFGNDLRAAHIRMAIAQVELLRAAAARAARRHHLGRAQHVADLAAVGAGVHAHRAAHRARDRASELDAGERSLRGAADDRGQRGAAPAADARAVDLDRGQCSLEMQGDAVIALVRDQQVGAEPDHGDVERLGLGPGQHLRQLRPPRSAAPGSVRALPCRWSSAVPARRPLPPPADRALIPAARARAPAPSPPAPPRA